MPKYKIEFKKNNGINHFITNDIPDGVYSDDQTIEEFFKSYSEYIMNSISMSKINVTNADALKALYDVKSLEDFIKSMGSSEYTIKRMGENL